MRLSFRRVPVGTDLVGGAAFHSGRVAMAVPERVGLAVLVQDVVLAVVDTGSAAGFFHNDVAGFFHRISPQTDSNILNHENMLNILSRIALYHNTSLFFSKNII